MKDEISTTELRNHIKDVVQYVHEQNKPIYITRDKQVVGVFVNAEQYEEDQKRLHEPERVTNALAQRDKMTAQIIDNTLIVDINELKHELELVNVARILWDMPYKQGRFAVKSVLVAQGVNPDDIVTLPAFNTKFNWHHVAPYFNAKTKRTKYIVLDDIDETETVISVEQVNLLLNRVVQTLATDDSNIRLVIAQKRLTV